MSVRSWIISFLLCYTGNVMAQTDSLKLVRYEQRLERYQRFFQSLTPDFVRLQYAGSTGLLNVGCGWEYGKHQQHETDIMFGYVPKYKKNSPFFTFTIRQSYIPWTMPLYKERFSFQPFSCGIFLNSVLDSEYWTREPERYPDRSYYRFSSKIRAHLFIGQRYSWIIPKHKRLLSRKVSAVWELSTCDLYVVSKALNESISFYETLSLSLGLKYDF